MFTPHPLLLLGIALAAIFVVLYLSFLAAAFRKCRQAKILQTSAAMLGIALLLSVLGVLLESFVPDLIIKLLINITFLVLQYKLGRTWLHLSAGRAILAIGISIFLMMTLTFGIIAML